MRPLRQGLVALIVLATTACVSAPPPAPSPAEQEARAVFVQLVAAARAGDAARFKALIAPADIKEMQAFEKENPGFMKMFMGLVADGGDPQDYQAQVKGEQVRFVRRVVEKTKDSSSTETTTVTMIKQDGRWVFGKPRS